MVLGSIDLDPASEEEANKRVKAVKFYTEEDNGLEQKWSGNVWLNPPGGKTKNRSNTVLFWQKLIASVESGDVNHAMFMAFSIEALQSTQKLGKRSIGEFMFCVPSKRIKFDTPEGLPDKHSPSHSNMLVYVPGIVDRSKIFIEQFESLGVIINR